MITEMSAPEVLAVVDTLARDLLVSPTVFDLERAAADDEFFGTVLELKGHATLSIRRPLRRDGTEVTFRVAAVGAEGLEDVRLSARVYATMVRVLEALEVVD